MSDFYIGQLLPVAFNFAPKGWAICSGQLMAINQNQALFSLLGTTYGGDGRTTFGLPDLRGRIPNGVGQSFTLGERMGEENHTLSQPELPTHFHTLNASNATANTNVPTGNLYASESFNLYGQPPNTPMNAGVVGPVGGSQAHSNQQPYLTINWIIALSGIFPSQN
jgi:microcystin-dependent protein